MSPLCSILPAIVFLVKLATSDCFQNPLPIDSKVNRSSLSLASNSVFTQVISDVDDTLKSSGGVNVAGVALGGIDVQYERGDFYPGVAEWMLEISRYGLPNTDANSPPKVSILHSYFSLPYATFQNLLNEVTFTNRSYYYPRLQY